VHSTLWCIIPWHEYLANLLPSVRIYFLGWVNSVVLISQWVKLKCICIKQFAPKYHIAMCHLMIAAVFWCYSGSHLTPGLWLMSCLSNLVRRCDFYICFPSPRVPQKLYLPNFVSHFLHLSSLGNFSFSWEWKQKISKAPA